MNSALRLFTTLATVLSGICVYAQHPDGLYFETRVAHESEWREGRAFRDATGFKGQWLNLCFDGHLNDRLTYSYRQRLNKSSSKTFFDATDWIHLDWKADDALTLSAGKQVVAIGGYEYDRAPIDLYYCSEFWNNIPCYQLGVSATYVLTPDDRLLFQVCNSPFREWAGNDRYALNLMWYGSRGIWETMWSANMMQSVADRWMGFLAFGNRFRLGDGMHLDVDVINRAPTDAFSLLKDFSLIMEFSMPLREDMSLFTKYTFDVNNTSGNDDPLVHPGTRLGMLSAGAEYMPSSAPGLKIFWVAFHSWGDNTNRHGTRIGGQSGLEFGLKWRLDILGTLK